MTADIHIEIRNNKLTIKECGAEKEQYIISENWPAAIDDICENLHDYLEGLG